MNNVTYPNLHFTSLQYFPGIGSSFWLLILFYIVLNLFHTVKNITYQSSLVFFPPGIEVRYLAMYSP